MSSSVPVSTDRGILITGLNTQVKITGRRCHRGKDQREGEHFLYTRRRGRGKALVSIPSRLALSSPNCQVYNVVLSFYMVFLVLVFSCGFLPPFFLPSPSFVITLTCFTFILLTRLSPCAVHKSMFCPLSVFIFGFYILFALLDSSNDYLVLAIRCSRVPPDVPIGLCSGVWI